MSNNNAEAPIFKFEDGQFSKAITLGELSQSLMLRDNKGLAPKSRPIQSWELIKLVHDEARSLNLEAEIKEIYVAQSGSNAAISREEKEIYKSGNNIPITKWLFGRITFMIVIRHTMDKDTTTAIVGTFHDKGLQIAMGQHVHVCSNMCIFGNNIMSTYGPSSMPFVKIEEMIGKWLSEFEEKRSKDLEIINLMKEYQIVDGTLQGMLDSMVGQMFRKAVRKNYFAGDDFVFNMTQCGDFVKQMETRINDPETQDKPTTMWDIYNWGTEILSPTRTEVSSIYSTNMAWGVFLHDFLSWNNAEKTHILSQVAVPISPAKKFRK